MLQAAGHNAQQHAADAAVEAVAVATRIVLHGRRMFANNYVHIDARGFCHRRHTGVVAGIAGHGALDF